MTERVPASSAHPLARGLRLGRPFGVKLVVHWSLVVIFALITVSLGAGVFPAWHPEWSPGLIWAVSLLSAVLFFVSVALHELSHALVGRTQGVPVERITLFIFGGMAQTDRQPPSPKAELLMAAAGPIASVVIGLTATLAGTLLIGDPAGRDPAAIIAAAGPLATLLLWLGPINLLLALFNMVPGFPLDGGRVLRAVLWWVTGSLRKATSLSSSIGQGFGWLLIASGVFMALGFRVPVLGVGLVPGLWLMLIGWFLHNAARMSYAHVVVGEALRDVPVRAVMRTRIETVPPNLPIERVINEYYMNSDQRAFPVVDHQLEGLVCLEDLRSIPREKWDLVTAADVMTPVDRLELMMPDEPALEALQRLSARDINQIPVVDGHHDLLGIVRREDIMKWLALRTRLDETAA